MENNSETRAGINHQQFLKSPVAADAAGFLSNLEVFAAKLFFCLFLLLPTFAIAQHYGSFQKYWFIRNSDTLPYQMLLPARYNPLKKYPLIIFLHGSGGRGNNNGSQMNNGGTLFIRDNIMLNYPAIVVFPQCEARSSWNTVIMQRDTAKKWIYTFPKDAPPKRSLQLLMELIPELEKNYAVDKERLYVGGLSMGGMGTYELVDRMPDTFAAAFVICGAGDTGKVRELKKTAWWLFHGQKDSTVYVTQAENMKEALEEAGADVKLTIYPEDGHDSWNDAFKEPGLFEWMFKKRLTN
ncbi:MAG: prolyl oligopeptidase family serine peptidase [Ginsengibacter sp.]